MHSLLLCIRFIFVYFLGVFFYLFIYLIYLFTFGVGSADWLMALPISKHTLITFVRTADWSINLNWQSNFPFRPEWLIGENPNHPGTRNWNKDLSVGRSRHRNAQIATLQYRTALTNKIQSRPNQYYIVCIKNNKKNYIFCIAKLFHVTKRRLIFK